MGIKEDMLIIRAVQMEKMAGAPIQQTCSGRGCTAICLGCLNLVYQAGGQTPPNSVFL